MPPLTCDELPSVDVHLLVIKALEHKPLTAVLPHRAHGCISMRGDLRCDWRLTLSSADTGRLALRLRTPGGRSAWQDYALLLVDAAAPTWTACCTGCGNQVLDLYYNKDPDPESFGWCRECQEVTYKRAVLSTKKAREYRRSIRGGDLAPVVAALQSPTGKVEHALVAMEEEGLLPRSLTPAPKWKRRMKIRRKVLRNHNHQTTEET